MPVPSFSSTVLHLSRNVRKRTFGQVRPMKIQISLRIHNLHWSAKRTFLTCALNEDSDQPADAQVDLSLRLAHMSKRYGFSRLRLTLKGKSLLQGIEYTW